MFDDIVAVCCICTYVYITYIHIYIYINMLRTSHNVNLIYGWIKFSYKFHARLWKLRERREKNSIIHGIRNGNRPFISPLGSNVSNKFFCFFLFHFYRPDVSLIFVQIRGPAKWEMDVSNELYPDTVSRHNSLDIFIRSCNVTGALCRSKNINGTRRVRGA